MICNSNICETTGFSYNIKPVTVYFTQTIKLFLKRWRESAADRKNFFYTAEQCPIPDTTYDSLKRAKSGPEHTGCRSLQNKKSKEKIEKLNI